MRPVSHVRDDNMKAIHFFIAAVFIHCLAGCTVHNHYYNNGSSPRSANLPRPGQERLYTQLQSIHTAMEAVAMNIANSETAGYKAQRIQFQEGSPKPLITINWQAGERVHTNSTNDLYIDGEGFFQVEILSEQGGGVAYTRVGNFVVNRDGELVLGNSEGPRLADGITIPEDAIDLHISPDGRVSVTHPDSTEIAIGDIELHRFVSPQGLKPIGGGLYCQTEASGAVITGTPGEGAMGVLMQCALESSNVNLIAEIMEMEKLNRWGRAIAQELGPAAIQHHNFFAFKRQADLSVQTGVIKQLNNAVETVHEQQAAEASLWPLPSLEAAQ